MPRMKPNSPPIRISKPARQSEDVGRMANTGRCKAGRRAKTEEEEKMQPQAKAGRMEAVAAHPLAELLACPQATGNLLNGSAQGIDFDAGAVVFSQSGECAGLYVVVSGRF